MIEAMLMGGGNMGMVIDKIQHIGTEGGQKPEDITIDAVDPELTFIVSSAEAASSVLGSKSQAILVNSTTVRVDAGWSLNGKTSVSVITAKSGIFVQRGSGSLYGTETTVTLNNSVDTGRSFIILDIKAGGGSTMPASEFFASTRFVGTNRIEITKETSGSSIDFAWQVVEFL